MSHTTQTILFDRGLWNEPRAEGWLQRHGYLVSPVDAKLHFLRYRQAEPDPSAHYATRPGDEPGVKIVYMYQRPPHVSGGRAASSAIPTGPPERRKIPGDRLTSDTELDEWGKANIPGFLGVVPRDQLTDLFPDGAPLQPGASAVLNLDPGYSNGGSHWVAVRVAQEGPQLMYFDSYGYPPPREVTLRGRRDGRGVLYPDVPYQTAEEVNCGPRSLAALKLLADGAKKGEELKAFGELGQV